MPRNAADYHGDNGLLYCGKCQTPKEAFFPKGLVLMGKNKHPAECACHKAERNTCVTNSYGSLSKDNEFITTFKQNIQGHKKEKKTTPGIPDYTFVKGESL